MTTTQLFIKMATVNDQNLYYGLNSVLDFQLYFILEGVIKGKDSPGTLIRRYEELQKNALDRGECNQCILAFSRVLYNQEVVFIYNTSNADVRNEYILIDHHLNKNHKWLTPVYGYTSNVEIHHSEDPANPVSYIKLYLIKIILEKIEDRLYPGISTKKIYQTAFKLLRKQSKPIAARYKLKSAIMELGPSGFPFEKYVAAILQHQGYKVQTSVMVQGKCVKHEVDVIAEKAEHHIKLHQGWVVTNTRFTTDAIQYGDCAGQ